MALRASIRKIVPKPPLLGNKVLAVGQIMQEQSNWCWAGCSDMVLDYYGNSSVSQCDFANWLFGLNGCCSAPSSGLCNQPCQVPDVSKVYSNWGIQSLPTSGQISFAALQSEINLDRPIEVAYAWTGGGGHVAIVRGYIQDQGNSYVLVNDPAYGASGGILYSDLQNAYGLGNWFYTWTGLRK